MAATQERQPRPPRRQVLRVDAQDESLLRLHIFYLHVPKSSLDVELVLTSSPSLAPTHNLTLSRTAREIVELDHKLHDTSPSVLRPVLPIDSTALPQPVKRKSVILNALSRLASPEIPSRLPRSSFLRQRSPDPFFDDLGEVAVGASNSASPTIAGLAAYLIALSNDQVFHQSRLWKRFVRIHTNNLESVRVERAIRRVRSDVAAHVSSPSIGDVTMNKSGVLDDTRRVGTEHKLREDALDGNEPALVSDSKLNSEEIPELAALAWIAITWDTTSTSPSAQSDVIEIKASDNGTQPSHTADLNMSADQDQV
ncbi:hypothetical protein EI94DRAFT_1815426 [Lactarius quietus]|nr:hypothetical protein EI94DRAFT_1815426 [Lactarius quietus]